MNRNDWLDNWENLPACAIPPSSPLRVVAEKREANRRECEEEYGPQDPLKNYPPKWWDDPKIAEKRCKELEEINRLEEENERD